MIHISKGTGRAVFIGKDGHKMPSKSMTILLAALAVGQHDKVLEVMQKHRLTSGEGVQLYAETRGMIAQRRKNNG